MELFFGMIRDLPHDLSLARMVESLVLLTIIWNRLKPHLTKLEDRLAGLEKTIKSGFDNGEQRFQNIERRINDLETQKEKQDARSNGKSVRFEESPQTI